MSKTHENSVTFDFDTVPPTVYILTAVLIAVTLVLYGVHGSFTIQELGWIIIPSILCYVLRDEQPFFLDLGTYFIAVSLGTCLTITTILLYNMAPSEEQNAILLTSVFGFVIILGGLFWKVGVKDRNWICVYTFLLFFIGSEFVMLLLGKPDVFFG